MRIACYLGRVRSVADGTVELLLGLVLYAGGVRLAIVLILIPLWEEQCHTVVAVLASSGTCSEDEFDQLSLVSEENLELSVG